MSAFCAICCDEAPDLVRRPLGRDGALVSVCTDCDTTPARVRHGPELGYPIPETERVSYMDFARAANAVTGPVGPQKGANTGRQAQPGWLMIKIPIKRDGKPIDAREAKRTLRDKPWFRDLRHLGSSKGYHLFERPDDKAAAQARRGQVDPIAGLEKYRRPR